MAKWLTRWSAKPVFMGSNPIRCSNQLLLRCAYSRRLLSKPVTSFAPLELFQQNNFIVETP